MTIDEITQDIEIEYLRLDDVTEAEKTLLEAVLVHAKAYISSYTGIPYTVSVSMTTEDDTLTKVETDSRGNVTTTTKDAEGTTTVVYKDSAGNAIEKPDNISNYPDLWLPCMILIQDAWDNRTYYVENLNMNKAVETALSMHVQPSTLLGGDADESD